MLKRQEGYILKHIDDKTYRLPYGQKIADCIVRLYGPAHVFSEKFAPFYLSSTTFSGCNDHREELPQTVCSDMDIEIILGEPQNHQNGTILLRNKELIVSCWEEGYLLQFPTLDNIIEAQITTNANYARIYCKNTLPESDCENLFLAIRPCFLYKAQLEGCFAIHSASILYQDQAWLFSGHSGMGKSTHTALWHDLLHTPYLNGDLNLVAQKNGQPVVYGIPWCGTSQISTAKTYPLGGIVLLGRADIDYLVDLEHYEKVLQVMQRMISPSWSASLMECNLDFAHILADTIPIYKLMCTKNPSALEVIKTQIDTLSLLQKQT